MPKTSLATGIISGAHIHSIFATALSCAVSKQKSAIAQGKPELPALSQTESLAILTPVAETVDQQEI